MKVQVSLCRIRQFSGLGISLLMPFLATATSRAADSSANRSNIVYIMADDHGRQAISCYGSKFIQTPNIDRLASEGMRFIQAFANNSICSPSRAVLLTGKYNCLCGVEKLSEHFDGSQQTFPKLLQQAGYQTAIIGKWHLWTQPTGYDYYCVYGNDLRYYNPIFKDSSQPWGNQGDDNGGTVHQGYVTDVITDLSLNWLEHRDTNKPFCLMIHHRAPHAPHNPAPRAKDLFKDVVFPEPPNLLDEYQGRAPELVADLLPWSRLLQQNEPQYQSIKKQFTGDRAHDTRLMYQEYVRNYLRLVATLDENVGRVLDYLDKSGLSKNTVVIYDADNGFFLGEHGFYNKMWMYEEGFRIPMIIRLPGMTSGATNSQFVSMLDVAPTILDLAGVKVPPDIQGVSMKPLLAGQPVKWRDALYYHYYGALGARDRNWSASHEIIGVATTTNKLIFYPTWKNGPFWEYFDLTKDSHEMNNLYLALDRQPEIADMKQRLRALAEHYQDANAVKYLDTLTSVPNALAAKKK